MVDKVDLVREGRLRRTPGRPPASLMGDGGTVSGSRGGNPGAGMAAHPHLPRSSMVLWSGGINRQSREEEEEEEEKLGHL